MKITDFLGEVVICPGTNKRYVITEITSPYITAREEKPGGNGYYKHYRWDTVNGDPISNGSLVFENSALNEIFIKSFDEYSHSRDAYWEEYGHWMRMD